MPRWWSFGGLLAALLAAGCAAYTEGIRPDEPLDGRYAYLYGRSFIHSDAGPMLPRGQAVGFVIDCADGNRYTFGSIRTRDVQVLKVAPSHCWFIEAVMADQDGIVRKRLPVDRSLQRPLDFQAGRAHYLGDYFAKGNFHSWSVGVFTIFQWRWAMDP